MSQNTLEIIERYHTFISTEQQSPFSSGEKFAKRLGEMFVGTKNFIAEQFSFLGIEVGSSLKYDKLVGIAESTDYAAMKNIPVLQPLRLNISWDEYALVLKKLQNELDGLEKNLLVPFNRYIGRALNDPNQLQSMQFKPEGYKFVDVKPLKKDLNKALSGQNKDHAPWSKAFKRNKDVRAFAETFNEVLLAHAKTKPEKIKASVDACVGNCQKLMEEIQNPTSEYHFNQKNALQVSELILQVAQHVELFTITHNLIGELERCATATQDAINIKK